MSATSRIRSSRLGKPKSLARVRIYSVLEYTSLGTPFSPRKCNLRLTGGAGSCFLARNRIYSGPEFTVLGTPFSQRKCDLLLTGGAGSRSLTRVSIYGGLERTCLGMFFSPRKCNLLLTGGAELMVSWQESGSTVVLSVPAWERPSVQGSAT